MSFFKVPALKKIWLPSKPTYLYIFETWFWFLVIRDFVGWRSMILFWTHLKDTARPLSLKTHYFIQTTSSKHTVLSCAWNLLTEHSLKPEGQVTTSRWLFTYWTTPFAKLYFSCALFSRWWHCVSHAWICIHMPVHPWTTPKDTESLVCTMHYTWYWAHGIKSNTNSSWTPTSTYPEVVF